MATQVQYILFGMVEDAEQYGLTVGPLHAVNLKKPQGTLRVFEFERWLKHPSRAGFYDAVWTLAPFQSHGTDEFRFLFTDANTAMEFKLAFG
ncbi:MAG: hypothetical protein EOP83_00255 [Verrucomicrobiaceae bacterium]|nr:MAG: hypothetical protein EOP83_00255 [Verrucomicrobiaceae bacterium]